MIAEKVEMLIRKYLDLFEQDIGDLGEVPATVMKDEEEPTEGELVRDIDNEMVGDVEEEWLDKLQEALGEGYTVKKTEEGEEGEGESYPYIIEYDDKKMGMAFEFKEGEGLVVFIKEGGERISVSLTPLIGMVSTVKDVINELMDNEEKFNEFVSVIRDVCGDVEVVRSEGETEVGGEKEEYEGGTEARESREKVIRMKRILAEKRKARGLEMGGLKSLRERLKRVRQEKRKIKEQKTGNWIDYEVKKIADMEWGAKQVEFTMEKGDVATKVLDRMMLRDIAKKVKPGDGYPDLIGYVYEPKEQTKSEEED